MLSLGTKANVGKTAIKRNTKHPRWQEQKWILLNTVTDSLSLSIFDFNEHRPDSLLGTVNCNLATLLEDSEQLNQVGKIQHEGRERGEVLYSLQFYPALAPKQLEDGTVQEPDQEVKEGIARLTVHQAKDFNVGRGTASTHAKVYLRGKVILKTPVLKHSNTPTYEASTEFLVADKDACQVDVAVIDDKASGIIGTCRVKLADILAAQENQQDWFNLKQTGKIRLTVDWKPLEIPGGLGSTSAWNPPIGFMRIFVKKAKGVKNVELGGKSDPYCRVMSHNTVTGRTETIPSNLNPEWNSYIYAPVHSVKDHLILEVMDYQTNTKDRSLGTVSMAVSDYAAAGTEGSYTSKGLQDREEPIHVRSQNGTKGKGVLYFQANFVPCIPVKGGIQFPEVANASQVLTESASVNPIQGTYTHTRQSSIRSVTHTRMASVESLVSNMPPPIPEKEVLEVSTDKGELESTVLGPQSGNDSLAFAREELLKQGEDCRKTEQRTFVLNRLCFRTRHSRSEVICL